MLVSMYNDSKYRRGDRKMKYTADNVMVQVIDTERLVRKLNASIHRNKPDDKTYEIVGTWALIRHPVIAIINDEFVGKQSNKFEFDMYGSEGGIHDCLPTYKFTLSLAKLEPFVKSDVTLTEFTKGRRGYNSRIISNESEWLKAFNR